MAQSEVVVMQGGEKLHAYILLLCKQTLDTEHCLLCVNEPGGEMIQSAVVTDAHTWLQE